MKNKITYLILAVCALLVTACSSDEKEVFSQSASQRIATALQTDREILESAEAGWELHYYAGENYSGAGYTYLLRFKDGKATVTSDFVAGDSTSTSTYELKEDEGPVLTFTTYNAIMHEKSLVSINNVNGEEGDYEFKILSATPDSIVLKGKKWKNKMVMRRLPANTNWKERIDSIHLLKLDLPGRFDVVLGDNEVIGAALVSSSAGTASFIVEGQNVSMPINFGPKNVELQTPLKVRGKEYTSFTWNSNNSTFTSGDLILTAVLPENYKPVSFWLGRWRVNHAGRDEVFLNVSVNSSQQLQVEFEVGGDRLPLQNGYDNVTGTLSFEMQSSVPVVPGNRSAVLLLPLGTENRFDQQPGAGFNFVWDEATQRARVVDKGLGRYPDSGIVGINFGLDGRPIENGDAYEYGLVILNMTSLTRVTQ